MKIQFGLRFKLLSLAAVPFIAFTVFAALRVKQDLNDWNLGSRQAKNINYLVQNINLVSNLQKERGLTFVFLQNGNGLEEIQKQRLVVDEALETYLDALAASELPELAKSSGSLAAERVPKLRKDIDAKDGTADFFFSRGSEIISGVLSITSIVADQPSTGGMDRLITSLAILQKAQESMAQFRGSISGILALKEGLDSTTFITVIRKFEGADILLKSPGLVLAQENRDALDTLQRGLEWRAVQTVLFDLSMNRETGNFSTGYEVFWNNSTFCIDNMNTITGLELAALDKKNQLSLQSVNKSLLLSMAGFFGAIIIILIVVLVFVKNLKKPVVTMVSTLKGIAGGTGDLSALIKISTRDEVGLLAETFNEFTASLSTLISDIKEDAVLLTQSGAELFTSLETVESAGDRISGSVDSLRSSMQEQSSGVTESAAVINRFLENVTKLTAMIEDQAANLAQTSASVEEMIANVNSSTQNIDTVSSLIEELVSVSGDGKTKVELVAKEAHDVITRSQALADTNKIISAIASQTNLLAMNAAIEAAHAGQYGAGFSVVADEIRKLAETAATRSKDISKELKFVREAIVRVVNASELVRNSFGNMDSLVQRVEKLELEIKNAMNEQSVGSEEVLKATQELNTITSNVRTFSMEMRDNGSVVLDEMNRLMATTHDVNEAAVAIATESTGIMESIEIAKVHFVKNAGHIESVTAKTNKFKLRE